MNQDKDQRLQQLLNWKQSMELKQLCQEQDLDPNINQNSLAQLTYKIAEKAFGLSNKKNIETKVSEMIEQQTCAICFELMVPPQYAPILLFPCGHTFCKECTIKNGKINIQKCSLCRAKVTAHAINVSLQNLICSFSEQKKENSNKQVQAQEPNLPENQYSDLYKKFKMRCDILQQEKSTLMNELKQLQHKKVQQEDQLEDLQAAREQLKYQILQQQEQLNQINNSLDIRQVVQQKLRINKYN
ncbi:hypothetical protein pb186bvf_017452 [Paramecium bursaria]